MTTPDLSPGAAPWEGSAGPLIDSKLNTAAATWALFVGIGLLMIGNSLQGSLIGIRSQSEGFSTVTVGVIMTAYFAGFLVGTRAVTVALASVGHIRVFAALASMASTAALVHTLAIVPASWVAMRFVTGVCMAGLYVVVESWLNDLATNKTRGRLLAIYMVVLMGGMAAGQLLLNVASPQGFRLFVLASVLVSLSLVPVTLSASSAPPTGIPAPMALIELIRIVPTGLTVSFFIGVAHGALLGMGAFYATSAGLRPSQVALFLGALMVGGVVFQVPVGWASDRFARRGVMLAIALLATLLSGGLLATEPGAAAAYLLMFLLGGMSFPLYSLASAYTNDWIPQQQVLGASARLVAVNGVGALLGPPLAAVMMATIGLEQFFTAVLIAHAVIVAFVTYRIVTRDGLPTDRQRHFVPFPARASAATANLLTGRRGPGRRRNGRETGAPVTNQGSEPARR
jgi:MFS family permease